MTRLNSNWSLTRYAAGWSASPTRWCLRLDVRSTPRSWKAHSVMAVQNSLLAGSAYLRMCNASCTQPAVTGCTIATCTEKQSPVDALQCVMRLAVLGLRQRSHTSCHGTKHACHAMRAKPQGLYSMLLQPCAHAKPGASLLPAAQALLHRPLPEAVAEHGDRARNCEPSIIPGLQAWQLKPHIWQSVAVGVLSMRTAEHEMRCACGSDRSICQHRRPQARIS